MTAIVELMYARYVHLKKSWFNKKGTGLIACTSKERIVKVVEIIEMIIYEFILKQRLWIINSCERRIKKLQINLMAEKTYLERIKEDTRRLLKKGTFM